MTPVDAARFTHRLATTLELLREARMSVEPRWPREQLLVQRDELFRTDRGLDHRRRCGVLEVVVVIVLMPFLRFVVRLLQQLRDLTLGRLDILGGDDAFAHEPLAPHLT